MKIPNILDKWVKITWHDASDFKDPWIKDEELTPEEDAPVVVVSSGCAARVTKRYVTLAGDYHLEHGTSKRVWGRVTKIPVGMIVKVEVEK